MGITEVRTAPRSPWQNPYAERVIGSIRRECLDHVIVLNAEHLRTILSEYLDYYHHDRTHLSLGKDTPSGRAVEKRPESGKVVALPRLGGLHHRYGWREAAWGATQDQLDLEIRHFCSVGPGSDRVTPAAGQNLPSHSACHPAITVDARRQFR